MLATIFVCVRLSLRRIAISSKPLEKAAAINVHEGSLQSRRVHARRVPQSVRLLLDLRRRQQSAYGHAEADCCSSLPQMTDSRAPNMQLSALSRPDAVGRIQRAQKLDLHGDCGHDGDIHRDVRSDVDLDPVVESGSDILDGDHDAGENHDGDGDRAADMDEYGDDRTGAWDRPGPSLQVSCRRR